MGIKSSLSSALDSAYTLDLTYVDDHLVMNEKEVWTWVRIPGEPLGIPTNEALDAHLERVHQTLESFRDVEAHYYLGTFPFDHITWRETVLRNQQKESESTGIQPAPAFTDYVERSSLAMAGREYKETRMYLGLRLGKRKNIVDRTLGESTTRFKAAAVGAKRWAETQFKTVDPQPKSAEVEYWTRRAIEVRQRLRRSRLAARPATQMDMWELIWHVNSLGVNTMSAMGTDIRPWGSGAIHELAAQLDTDDRNSLKFTRVNPHLYSEYRQYQQDKAAYDRDPAQNVLPTVPEPFLTGHAIVMAVDLSEEVDYPWVYYTTRRSVPVDVSIRFRVVSPKAAEQEAQKIQERKRQELEHQQDSGIIGGNVKTRKEYLDASRHAEDLSTGQGRTQTTFTARFIVHGESLNDVTAGAQELKQFYDEELHIKLQWIGGSQELLWKETIPGQLVQPKMYVHHADIDALTNGLLFSCNYLGYQDGFYVGNYGQYPFLFDPARAARMGKAPAIIFNGSLGGGKTVGMMLYLDLFRLRSYTSIAIDPKRDLLSHQALQGRGHLRIWDLTTDGRPGVLDPFTLIPIVVDKNDPKADTEDKARQKWREETLLLVTDTIAKTVGESRLSPDMRAIINDVAGSELRSPNPTMAHILERLNNGDVGRDFSKHTFDDAQLSARSMVAVNLHALLHNTANSALGTLIYGEKTGDLDLIIKDVPTTIINVAGLDLPQPGEAPAGDSQVLSVTLFSLIAAYAQRLLENPRLQGPKALLIDEFQMIKDLPALRSMATRANRMGRSLNITPMYADQSSRSSMENDAFANATGARVVFRSNSQEAEAVAKSLSREGDMDLIQAIPDTDSRAGLALHTTPADPKSDHPDTPGIGVVSFDVDWNPEYLNDEDGGAFYTNPDRDDRAAYRQYPLDAYGVLHDPYSDTLDRIEPEAITPADDSLSPSGPVAEPEVGENGPEEIPVDPSERELAPVSSATGSDEAEGQDVEWYE